MDVETVKW